MTGGGAPISQEALALLKRVRWEYSSTALVTEAMVEMARLYGDPTWARGLDDAFGRAAVERMLSGQKLPCAGWRERIAQITRGFILPEMWDREAGGDIQRDVRREFVTVEVGETPAFDPVIEAGDDPDTLAVVRGRLGETPSGPLFSHVIGPPSNPNSFVITGLGIALHLTPSSFAAFCRAGQAALDEMAAA